MHATDYDVDALLESLGGTDAWAHATRFSRSATQTRKAVRGRVLQGISNAACVTQTGERIDGMCSIASVVSLLVAWNLLPSSYATQPERVYDEFPDELEYVASLIRGKVNERVDVILLFGLLLQENVIVFFDEYDLNHVDSFMNVEQSAVQSVVMVRGKGAMSSTKAVSMTGAGRSMVMRKLKQKGTTVHVVTNYADALRPHHALHDAIAKERPTFQWIGGLLYIVPSLSSDLHHVSAVVPWSTNGLEIFDANFDHIFTDVSEYRRHVVVYGGTNVYTYSM